MAKEYNGSHKVRQLESRNKKVTQILMVAGLCILFYILGSWQNTTSRFKSTQNTSIGSNNSPCGISSSTSSLGSLEFQAHDQVGFNETSTTAENFPSCDLQYSEYTPCQDPRRSRKFGKKMLKYRERHCPKKDLLRCLIPAPPKYKNPFKWPQRRDYAWYDNIPHRELSIEKAVQNWIQVEGDKFKFPGGGTMFPRGADAYIDDIDALVPLTKGNIRTAIDTGCGILERGVSRSYRGDQSAQRKLGWCP